ncbi:uncharacterized protein EDB91DRAFT_1064581 [Suillus paluster]|jgi:hypothetical protein|uniref:uncharacterized protein n=2 Tax=Suillus paluster TaxID=48578 RepID=UPI001B879092|nr:uncharacterized protein EDB91DRAFT_1064581 [Suillus paluster]KAG1721077.1 hypothetical protein EDB91DRAFT_1064581 [Suillus paluster]
MSEPEAQCALNPDGSLKDAKDIVFYNDPDDAVPISTPSSAQPPTDAFSVLLQTGRKPVPLTAGARRSIRTSKPSARLRDSDNACSSTSRKRALSSATEQLVRKKVVLQLSAPLSDDEDSHAAGADTDIDTDHGAGQSDEAEDDDVPAPEDEPEDEPEDLQDTTIRATLSKSERTADIRTIFTRDDKHWVCKPCRDAGELESKYTFRGGISTLRTHICRYVHVFFLLNDH